MEKSASGDLRSRPLGRAALVVFLLYWFLVGVKSLETGISSFGSGFTDTLFQGATNPLAGLFVGILATVLVQSSSVTTATIVGLVGGGALSVEMAVPMVMGANIGTTVTNTLVSLGHVRKSEEFRRAIAAATMHDFFNVMSVIFLLPLQVATGFLSEGASAIAELFRGRLNLGPAPDSPVKSAVQAPVRWFEGGLENLGASDDVIGATLIILGIGLIFVCLVFITRNMRALLAGRIERSMNAVLAGGAGLAAMTVGLVITVSVQSSSITTSMLIPLVASGVLLLRNAYPITLGANLGTTVTALLASLAATGPEALIVALSHTLFNLAGILVFYPVHWLRHVPVRLAEWFAGIAMKRKTWTAVYVVGGFIVVPLVGLLLIR